MSLPPSMSLPPRTRICKVLVDDYKTQYVALIDWKTSTFDIQLSDGTTAWQGVGVKAPGNADPSQWMATAHQALCELHPPRSYTYRMKPSQLQAGALRLSWDWKEATGGTLTDHVTLFPAGYGAQILQSMLLYLATSYSELRDAAVRVESHCQTLQQKLSAKDAALQEEISNRMEREQQLFLKFAEVLNKKKQHLIILNDRIKQLEAEVTELNTALQEENEIDSEDEARQQEQIAALYARDTEDEEEEDEGGGAEDMEVEVATHSVAAPGAATGVALGLDQQQQQWGGASGIAVPVGAPKLTAATEAVADPTSAGLFQQQQQQQHGDLKIGLNHGSGEGNQGVAGALQQGTQGQDYAALLEAATQPLPMDVLQQHRPQQGHGGQDVGPSETSVGVNGGVDASRDGPQAHLSAAATAPDAAEVGVSRTIPPGQGAVDGSRQGAGAVAGNMRDEMKDGLGANAVVGGSAQVMEQDDPLGQSLAGLVAGGGVASSNPSTFKVRKKRAARS